jgi:hypothetical protein
MRRVGGAVLGLVLGLGVVAGCGGDEGESAERDYCTLLAHFDARLHDTDWRTEPDRISSALENVVAEAPEQVRRPWARYDAAFRASLRFLGKHVVDPDAPPRGMSSMQAGARNRQTFNRAMRPVRRAGPHTQRIRRHAKAECGFRPGL